MPSGVTLHVAAPAFVVLGVPGVFGDDAVSAGGVADAERDVPAEAPGWVFSGEQPAVAAMRSTSIDRMCTGRSLESRVGFGNAIPMPYR